MLEFNSCGTGCELPHGFSMVALATKLRNCRRPALRHQKEVLKSQVGQKENKVPKSCPGPGIIDRRNRVHWVFGRV
jgi:hypothetical protein